MEVPLRRVALGLLLVLALCMSSCGPSSPDVPSDATSSSSGQVVNHPAAPLTDYAAARLADHASFGATPALLADMSQRGVAGWIGNQMALPVSRMDAPASVVDFDNNDAVATRRALRFPAQTFINLALTAPDQLRLRVSWALMQFIPVNIKVQPYGLAEHFNLLQRHAFGNYGALLRELTIHPAMGWFLDNQSNRPTSAQCLQCAPNENYARELMQLFSLGVVKLNPDGTTVRDASGRVVETYDQEDVEELARAFTGWRFAPSTTPLPTANKINAGKLMVPEDLAALHDSGAKKILGTNFPAGRNAVQELDAVVSVLMNHGNIAPFVSLRLIQHLVTSNPTPQYVARVAAVFRNNGQGVAGDMKAVVSAVLTDVEARRGDVPGMDTTRIGKLREPVLWFTAMLRGLGCTQALQWNGGEVVLPLGQQAFNPASVFSFYLPTDRAPGSNLLAPEQRLLNTSEFMNRLGNLRYLLVDVPANAAAGCDVNPLGQAFERSPQDFIDLLNTRHFRGVMPPTLRHNLTALATGQKGWNTSNEAAMLLLQYALTTPYFGVIQ